MKFERKLLIVSIIFTFLIGTYGFYQSYSTSIFDCCYAALSLFFMNCLASNDQIKLLVGAHVSLVLMLS